MENSINKIDDLGRVLIPKEIREIIGWRIGDSLQLIPNPKEKTLTLKILNEGD